MSGHRPVIDAHHHLWLRSTRPPWVDPQVTPVLDGDFGPERFDEVARAARVEATVAVQAVPSEDETIGLLRWARDYSTIAGVVGWVDVASPLVAERVAALREAPGGERLVGIRPLVQDEPDPHYLDHDSVRQGVAEVGAHGLVFDVLVYQHQLPAAVRAARDLPGTSFVLNHLAKPDWVGRDGFGQWRDLLYEFAELPNTTAKLSGVLTEAKGRRWSSAQLHEVIRTAVEAFGTQRLMFGSDWPVSLQASPYDVWLAELSAAFDELGVTDSGPWAEVARRVYGLGSR